MRPMVQRQEHEDQPDLTAGSKKDRLPRILIADKSPVVRAGLEDYIRRDGPPQTVRRSPVLRRKNRRI
jgi:hypothetical protein